MCGDACKDVGCWAALRLLIRPNPSNGMCALPAVMDAVTAAARQLPTQIQLARKAADEAGSRARVARVKADKLAKLLSERMEEEQSSTSQIESDVQAHSKRSSSGLGRVSVQEVVHAHAAFVPCSLPSILEDHAVHLDFPADAVAPDYPSTCSPSADKILHYLQEMSCFGP